jgi:RNA polymerase sigma-70 factor (ECF subfamily)
MEREIHQLLKKGQLDAAFEQLVQLYQTKVFRLVFSIVQNHSRSEEVTQDAFIKVWQALSTYDGRASFSTWIYTIARNTALTHLRSEKYRRTSSLESVAEPSVLHSKAGLEVERLLTHLPEEQRETVELFYLQGCSIDDVAAMLDIPEGTVKSHLHRARKAMAAMMEVKP